MEKKEIRARTATAKRLMSPDARRIQDAAIWSQVEQDPDFLSARAVLAFCSLPDEPDTSAFIARWHGSKRIVLPLVKGDLLVLKEYVPGSLHEGYKGILEPSDNLPDVSPEEIDFALIPGVAFDRNGGRLGRGKGFYDRLLPRLHCTCAGVAWPCQMVDSVPSDPWDRPVDKVYF